MARQWNGVDTETLRREILPRYEPAVLKGFVAHWPAVRRAVQSAEAVCSYLSGFDNGTDVDAVMTPPGEEGRIFYKEDLSAFNFMRNRLPISAVLDQIKRYRAFATPPSVAVQSALISGCLPGFAAENRLDVFGDAVPPRIWIGNMITTPAHIDESSNIACVVSGRRRFTLFPPDQAPNLYLGPLDFTPTGSPISLVKFKAPDFERFPRFRTALEAARVAELEPGDAIFIPALWWHHVESLDQVNILVNYWWKGPIGSTIDPDSPFDGLMHCLLAIKHLPPEHKKAWRALFEHYVFNTTEDPAAHIPPARRGVLGALTPQREAEIKAWLIRRLQP